MEAVEVSLMNSHYAIRKGSDLEAVSQDMFKSRILVNFRN